MEKSSHSTPIEPMKLVCVWELTGEKRKKWSLVETTRLRFAKQTYKAAPEDTIRAIFPTTWKPDNRRAEGMYLRSLIERFRQADREIKSKPKSPKKLVELEQQRTTALWLIAYAENLCPELAPNRTLSDTQWNQVIDFIEQFTSQRLATLSKKS